MPVPASRSLSPASGLKPCGARIGATSAQCGSTVLDLRHSHDGTGFLRPSGIRGMPPFRLWTSMIVAIFSSRLGRGDSHSTGAPYCASFSELLRGGDKLPHLFVAPCAFKELDLGFSFGKNKTKTGDQRKRSKIATINLCFNLSHTA